MLFSKNCKTVIGNFIFFGLIFLSINGCNTTNSNSQNGQLFKSGDIGHGETFNYTFNETGTYDYFCEIHKPDMKGSIVVETGTESTNPDTVEMKNSAFVPSQLTVQPGTKVVWINRDSFAHTVVSGTPGKDVGGGGTGGGGGYY